MPKKRAGHVRVHCPHCGRDVNVQRPQGFQRSVPCPNCRIPISTELIAASEAGKEAEETPQADAEAGGTEA